METELEPLLWGGVSLFVHCTIWGCGNCEVILAAFCMLFLISVLYLSALISSLVFLGLVNYLYEWLVIQIDSIF